LAVKETGLYFPFVSPRKSELAARGSPDDVLLACPGRVYRRDAIDRLHTGEPHQMDLWRIRRGRLDEADLEDMAARVVGAALPGRSQRLTPAVHPYTIRGRQIDVVDRRDDGIEEWIEVGEWGLALPSLLDASGLDSGVWRGLALGLGLDRLLMLAKGIDDIRVLSARDGRIARQMLDLEPWQPVSNQPPVRRDLSVALAADRTAEEVGDRVRAAMGDDVDALESVEIVAETARSALPAAAIERIGIAPGQKNALIRLVIRHPSRALTSEEANALRDRVYAAVHEGTAWQWAGGGA
jgi:phenylalanyl-tRNA synthetase alpha chain